MKLKKIQKRQLQSAIFMAFMGVCLGAYSPSFISFYDKPQPEQKSEAPAPSQPTAEAKIEAPKESLPEEPKSAFTPSLEALNLAFLYPEGEEKADGTSLGEQVAQALSLKDSDWLSSIYQLANSDPMQAAKGLGLPKEAYSGISFENIRIQFLDENGKQISTQSNIQEIMSMANTYFYYTAPEDYDGFLSYCLELWEKSHSFQYSISEVYTCDGSLDSLALEESGLISTPSEAAPSTEETVEASLTGQEAEQNLSQSAKGLSETEEELETELETQVTETEIGPGIALYESSSPEEPETEAPLAETKETLTPVCKGHADLNITAVISGLSHGEKGLYSLDTTGGQANEESGWPGWIEETRSYADKLAGQDWSTLYGLTLSPAFLAKPLTYAEINSYLTALPDGISEERQKLIRYALSSVGRVPYYWGGKPAAPGYEGNHFGALIAPDEKGRSLKGLDCSGWISWIYWSALGKRLGCESTGGLASCGTPIDRSNLQPGDIILKTGDSAHVVMFLSWEQDGNMKVIHESSALVNNVTITTMAADWTNYRKLID